MRNIPENKIEVTHEMASAGAEEVSDYDGEFVTATEIAIRAYRAMELVRRASRHAPQERDPQSD